jgi:hypothetical protein
MSASEYMQAVTREENRGALDAQLEVACGPPVRCEKDYDQATHTQWECIRSAYYRGFGTSIRAQEGGN